jgi:hypothetical protein
MVPISNSLKAPYCLKKHSGRMYVLLKASEPQTKPKNVPVPVVQMSTRKRKAQIFMNTGFRLASLWHRCVSDIFKNLNIVQAVLVHWCLLYQGNKGENICNTAAITNIAIIMKWTITCVCRSLLYGASYQKVPLAL